MNPQPGESIAIAVIHPIKDHMRFLIHPLGAGPTDGTPEELAEFAEDALVDNILIARASGLEPSVWRLYIVSQEWASSRLGNPYKAAHELLDTTHPVACTCGCCEQSEVAPLAVAAARGDEMAEA
jgi:hypothetical protein